MRSTQPFVSAFSSTRTPANEALSMQGQIETKKSLYQTPVQCKLSIGAADDPLEKEADDMADKVMRMEMPSKVNFSSAKNTVNRKCAHCEEGEKQLQRKECSGESVSVAPPIVHDVIKSSGGRSLDTGTRSFMEARFNYDFSSVKIHDGDVAAKSASSINALAYTSGNNVVFNSGQYNTSSDSGKRLLAHELTHVVQQNTEVNASRIQRWDWGRAGLGALIGGGIGAGLGALIGGAIGGGIGAGIGAAIGGLVGAIGGGIIGGLTGEKECRINYSGGKMNEKMKIDFLTRNFTEADRPSASEILNDLCAVENDKLNFSTEDELKNEIKKRLLVGKYMQESQLGDAFGYPEEAKDKNCPGAVGNALSDAQVNLAARDYWNGPFLETRSKVRGMHYYFDLSPVGKNDAYKAIKLLFISQSDFCNRTLIHCDTLITLVNMLAYAETIGIPSFNAKVKSGLLGIWLTYDGLSSIENDSTPTVATSSLMSVTPSNEDDLVIGDHVVFWNHQAYDAISVMEPGPWRLENAILVKKAANGDDLFEGHGAPIVSGSVQPGTRRDIHTELMNAYNPYAKEAADLADKKDSGNVDAGTKLAAEYPQVFKNGSNNKWYIKELDRNNTRPRQMYELREITDPFDPEIIGLRNPYNTSKMTGVNRPAESL